MASAKGLTLRALLRLKQVFTQVFTQVPTTHIIQLVLNRTSTHTARPSESICLGRL
eukprot:SAG11_NODE_10446_length_831_cov_1.214481_1_plen_55_part_10